MAAKDIITRMRESSSKLLQTEAEDLAKWKELKHTKECLELFLQFNLVRVTYRKKSGVMDTIVCTTNPAFIKIFSAKKPEDKKQFVHLPATPMRCDNKHAVALWDMMDNKLKTIPIDLWQIDNFIGITTDNVLILDEIAKKLLKI